MSYSAVAGVIGGVTGGLAGFPGALVTIWCGVKGQKQNGCPERVRMTPFSCPLAVSQSARNTIRRTGRLLAPLPVSSSAPRCAPAAVLVAHPRKE